VYIIFLDSSSSRNTDDRCHSILKSNVDESAASLNQIEDYYRIGDCDDDEWYETGEDEYQPRSDVRVEVLNKSTTNRSAACSRECRCQPLF